MLKLFNKLCILGALALLLAVSFAVNPHTSKAAYAASTTRAAVAAAQTAQTTGWANVRSGPGTTYPVTGTDAPGTTVTIYDTVAGQSVWGGLSTWYRVSSSASSPLYIYGGLVALSSGDNTTQTSDTGGGSAPTGQGKVIVVTLSQQWLRAYEDGKEVFNTAVLTGRPELATPTGTYHVLAKLTPATFYSPWPVGSPYYYAPITAQYALQWRSDGYYLHDAWWHSAFGPGTNTWHNDPKYGWQDGSHGCINMPLSASTWLYNWAPIGTTVQVNP